MFDMNLLMNVVKIVDDYVIFDLVMICDGWVIYDDYLIIYNGIMGYMIVCY